MTDKTIQITKGVCEETFVADIGETIRFQFGPGAIDYFECEIKEQRHLRIRCGDIVTIQPIQANAIEVRSKR